MSYKDYIKTNVPTVLQGPNASPKVQSYGQLQDIVSDLVRDGVIARFPERGPTDALQYLETERGIDRAIAESDPAFATRLKEAWTVWPYAGSARGVLKALKDSGYDALKMYLFQQNGLYWQISAVTDVVTATAISSPFSFWLDGTNDFNFWSHFTIVFAEPPLLWNTSATVVFTGAETSIDVTWDQPFDSTDYSVSHSVLTTDGTAPTITISGKTGMGVTVNGGPFIGEVYLLAWTPPDHPLASPRDSELNKLCRLVDRWKAARSIFDGFVVRLQGTLWGFPVQDWGDPGLVWGGGVSARVYC